MNEIKILVENNFMIIINREGYFLYLNGHQIFTVISMSEFFDVVVLVASAIKVLNHFGMEFEVEEEMICITSIVDRSVSLYDINIIELSKKIDAAKYSNHFQEFFNKVYSLL